MSRESELERALKTQNLVIQGLREVMFSAADLANRGNIGERDALQRLAIIASSLYDAAGETIPEEPGPPKLRLVDPDDAT
jgi:hypothetical protein